MMHGADASAMARGSDLGRRRAGCRGPACARGAQLKVISSDVSKLRALERHRSPLRRPGIHLAQVHALKAGSSGLAQCGRLTAARMRSQRAACCRRGGHLRTAQGKLMALDTPRGSASPGTLMMALRLAGKAAKHKRLERTGGFAKGWRPHARPPAPRRKGLRCV